VCADLKLGFIADRSAVTLTQFDTRYAGIAPAQSGINRRGHRERRVRFENVRDQIRYVATGENRKVINVQLNA